MNGIIQFEKDNKLNKVDKLLKVNIQIKDGKEGATWEEVIVQQNA